MRVTTKSRRAWILGARVLLLLMMPGACSHHEWRVRQQVSPNPFMGARFTLYPVNFEGARVGIYSEEQYLRYRHHAQSEFDQMRAELSERLQVAVREQANGLPISIAEVAEPPESGYVIKPNATLFDPGDVDSGIGEVQMNVTIATPAGQVLDVFSIDVNADDPRSTVQIGGLALGVGRRPPVSVQIGQMATRLAHRITRYIRERTTVAQ